MLKLGGVQGGDLEYLGPLHASCCWDAAWGSDEGSVGVAAVAWGFCSCGCSALTVLRAGSSAVAAAEGEVACCWPCPAAARYQLKQLPPWLPHLQNKATLCAERISSPMPSPAGDFVASRDRRAMRVSWDAPLVGASSPHPRGCPAGVLAPALLGRLGAARQVEGPSVGGAQGLLGGQAAGEAVGV
ncbi:MAG: hypothetical protein FRX49_07493 [Trebouxia sp. A1-2]|nr:MAG: hypothetical protein FRX49_07493 [Trebouxia sp. A1-2]